MLQEVKETSSTTRKLTINIPSDAIEAEIANAYNDLKARVKIPGFRQGKVPPSILEKKFGKDIKAQVLEKIVPEFYMRAIKEAQLSPISYPSIEEKLELVKDQPLSFTATVEIRPEIKDLKYEGIILKEKAVSVEKEELEAALRMLQESRTILEVTDGPIKEGDVAIIDCEASIDTKKVDEFSFKDYPLILSSHKMPKEFSEALLNRKKGEKFEIKIKIDSNYPDKTIADQEVLFKVSINDMKERVAPALDDEFAKGFDCKSVNELREKISENITNRKKNEIKNEHKKELVDNLNSNHDFEVPASLVNREIASLIEEVKQDSIKPGEELKSDAEMQSEFASKASDNIKTMLILDAIGKKEKVEVSEDDMKEAIDEVAAQHQLKPEEVKKLHIMRDGSLDGLKSRLYSNKVLELILSRAKIE